MKQRHFSLDIDGQVIIDTLNGAAFQPNVSGEGVQPYVAFDVTIDALGHVTYCDLSLANLAEETINVLFKRGAVIGLRAGYADNMDYIFTGIVRNVFRSREQSTTFTQIIARGGELSKNHINVSLGEKAKLSEIIKSISSAMGYPLVFTESEFTEEYVTGYTMTGNPETALDKLARAHDFNWTVENERLIVFRVEQGRKSPTKTINMLNGLEGVPELTEVGVDFSVRMDPSIKIGARIELDTTYRSFNFSNVYYENPLQDISGSGEYTVMKITHSGDNGAGSSTWTTRCSGYRSNYVSVS